MRIKISLPEHFEFQASIPVRITDLNYGGHVGNDTVLSIIHEARIQFLKSHGYSEMDIEGQSLIMGDVGIEFKGELFYGDTVTAKVGISDISKVSFSIYYLLETTRNGNTITVAKAKTGMVCFDYKNRKVNQLPDGFMIKFAK